MSTEIPGHANGDLGKRLGAGGKVPTLFPAPQKTGEKADSPARGNGGTAQPDPLKQLVQSLQRWDDHVQDHIRDVERRLTGVHDRLHGSDEKVRRHDEMFPVVNQNLKTMQDALNNRFQSVQGALNSQNDRIGKLAARLDAHTNQLLSVEAGMVQIAKDVAALRAQVGGIKRGRSWPAWLAVLALLGVLALAAVQFGLVDVAAALIRMVDFGWR